jgi:flavin reductase (DIM6/NTAB) family NADH-FMN oxidoreductase RutF
MRTVALWSEGRPWNEPPPGRSPEEQAYRDTLARLAGGVTLLTAVDTMGRDCGITATAVTSVSLDPALVLVCVRRSSFMHDALVTADGWGLSFLAAGMQSLAEYAARHHHPGDRDDFSRWPTRRGASTGARLVVDGLGAMELVPWHQLDAGDHTIVVGQVVAFHRGDPDARPLVYVDRDYHEL